MKEDRREREKLRSEGFMRIVNMDDKVTGDEEFMRCGSSYRKEGSKFIEKNRERFSKGGRCRRTIDIKYR